VPPAGFPLESQSHNNKGTLFVDILLLFGLILLNGLFAMTEMSLVTAKRNRLQRLADAGDKSAAIAIELGEDPTRFMSTVQIGITAIGVFNGIVGEEAFAGPLSLYLTSVGMDAEVSSRVATAFVVVIITYLTIVLGELVPKRIGQNGAERIARHVARPISLLATLSRPFVILLTRSTNAVLRLLGARPTSDAELTEEDIHAMLHEGSESGLIEKQEHDMVRKVFRLEDRLVTTLMTPRGDIDFLDTEDSVEHNIDKVLTNNHTLYPVCDGSLDHLRGLISAKALLKLSMENNLANLAAEVQPGVFLPESMTGMQLLEHFRNTGEQMVFVVNEYGEVLGLVTQQNLLEALVGEFHAPADPHDTWAVQREDGSWLLDGLIPIHELKDRLQLKSVPEEEKSHYNTLSGMMMWLLGNVPKTGAICHWQGWKLEVIDMDGNRLDKVLATWQSLDDGSG